VGWQRWRCWLTGRWTFASSVNDVFAVCAVGGATQILAESVHSDRKKDGIVFPHMACVGCVVNALVASSTKQC
jgi:predicted Rdx family selenoprotein